jgi:hypothetical protein
MAKKRYADVDGSPVLLRAWPLLPAGVDALTLPKVILIRADRIADVDLLEHEFEHVRQWRRIGYFGFLRQYLHDYITGRGDGLGHHDAYLAIKLEVDARAAAATRRRERNQDNPA